MRIQTYTNGVLQEEIRSLSNTELSYVDEAVNLSFNSDLKFHRHGSVIEKSGKIWSTGYNHFRSSLKGNFTGTVHAEVFAIWNATKKKQLFYIPEEEIITSYRSLMRTAKSVVESKQEYERTFGITLDITTNKFNIYQEGQMRKKKRKTLSSRQRKQRTTKSKCENSNLWVVRAKMDPDGSIHLRNSRPCMECLAALIEVGINRVYYSTDNGDIICTHVKDMISTHITYYQGVNLDSLNYNWKF